MAQPNTALPVYSLDWQPQLGADALVEGYDDIGQCIKIILLTRKGSDPHRPDFGSDLWRYIDYPQNRAVPHLVREAVDALRRWEPRLTGVTVSVAHNIGNIVLTVTWTAVLGGGTTQVEL